MVNNSALGVTFDISRDIYCCETKFIPYLSMIQREIAARIPENYSIDSIQTGVFYLDKNRCDDDCIDISFMESSGMFWINAYGEKRNGWFSLNVKMAYTKKGEILNKLE